MSIPVTTLRKASVELVSRLTQVKKWATDKPNVLTLNGEAGAGKSVALLHAMSYALHNRWIVIYIPDGTLFISTVSDGSSGRKLIGYCRLQPNA